MGLFDKKYCDICGEKIGLLGNCKLDDGNLCKECAKKLSPWFEERRHSTVEEIKRQLAYREQNKELVQKFNVTRQISTKTYNVFIDDIQGNFTIAHKLDVKENPDIVPLSAVLQCKMDIEQDRKEETYTKDGKTVSYDPPVYKYEYQYRMKIQVRSPWFDDMDFRLHNFSIEQDDRAEIMEIERAGYEIVSALTGQAPMGMQGMNGMPVNNGMNYGMQGMNGMPMNNSMQGMNGMPVNNGMNYGMQGMNGMPVNNGMNYGMQGMNGMPMNNSMQGMNGMPMNNSMQGMNGMPMNNSMQGMNSTQMNNSMPVNNGMRGNQQMQQLGGTLKCQCGAENKGKFCEYCGQPRPF